MKCAFCTRAEGNTLSLSCWSVVLPTRACVKKVLEPRQQSQRHAGLCLFRLLRVKELKRRKTLRGCMLKTTGEGPASERRAGDWPRQVFKVLTHKTVTFLKADCSNRTTTKFALVSSTEPGKTKFIHWQQADPGY